MQETWYVVYLGNTGSRYDRTRHNAGWIVSDGVCRGVVFGYDKYLQSWIAREEVEVTRKGVSCRVVIVHIKPSVMMNNSGEVFRHFVGRFGDISPDTVIAVYDDIDGTLGTFRLSYGIGDGNHNGVKSLISELKTRNFARIRIGVSDPNEPRLARLRGFVLGEFSDDELDIVAGLGERVRSAILDSIARGVMVAMNTYNK